MRIKLLAIFLIMIALVVCPELRDYKKIPSFTKDLI